MRRVLQKTIAALLAVLMLSSFLSVTAVELEDENGEPSAAEVGAGVPVITSMRSDREGVRIEWQTIAGIHHYRVDKWYSDGRGWQRLTDTTQLYYVDLSVVSGNTYRYRLYGMTASNDVMTTTASGSITYSAPAVLTGADTTDEGIRIYWNKASGVSKVAVLRMENSAWKQIAVSSENSYLDENVTYGNRYRYTVRELTSSGAYMFDYFDETGLTHAYLRAPVLSVENTTGGVMLKWDAIEGAEGYRVFYRGSNGWTRMATTENNYLLDDDVRSGNTYTYTVRCVTADGERYTSDCDTTGKSIRYIAAPVLLSATGTDSGIRITWQACPGADKYRVFYRGKNGWTRMADTTETSYLDEEVNSGVTYTYTVCCMNAAGEYVSAFDRDGIKGTYMYAPDFSVSNGTDGVDITWQAVQGAEKYRIYYYGSRGWTKLVDTTDTSYVDTDVESGYNYTYTVRCVNDAGDAFLSSFRPGVSHTFINAPDFELVCNEKSITIRWDAVEGAELYRVYYRGANGWTKLADTTQTSFEDDDIESGYNYTYTVRCLNKEETQFTSDFYPGKSMRYVEMPKVTSVKGGAEGVEVTWSASKGATKYRVYYKTDGGWTKAGETTSNTFVHNAESGRDYTYTVRCINAEGTQFESTFDGTGKSLHYIAAPQNLSAECDKNRIKISWKPSAGAAKYRVYYYGRDGWTRLTETTGTSVIDDDVSSGYTYRYTVRCISADGNSFTSDFNHDGVLCPFTYMPVMYEPDFTRNGIEISWKALRKNTASTTTAAAAGQS